MKKLMFALAAVAIASFAGASTVDWKTTAVYHGNAEDKIAEGSVGYLVLTSGDTPLTQAAIIEALSGVGASAAGTWLSENAVDGGTKAATSANKFVMFDEGKDPTYAAGMYTAYAVIFDTETVTDSSKFYVTTGVATEVPASGAGLANWNSTAMAGAKEAGAWNSVAAIPEPTSGLLLLLGMAGLALRRRRA